MKRQCTDYFIKRIAQQAGITRTQANIAFSAVIDEMSEALAREEEVRILGFGTFYTLSFKLSYYRTEGEFKIPNRRMWARFRAGEKLKKACEEG